MILSVQSEVSDLQKVLLHRPGAELEQLTPNHLRRMLFDDIPYLHGAQKEHDAFADTLRKEGAEVLYIEDMTAETLRQDKALKQQFIRDFIRESGGLGRYYEKELVKLLNGIEDEKELVLKTMSGVTDRELELNGRHPLVRARGDELRFILDPIPNLYFTRDPFSVIGHGAVISSMKAGARRRETIYGRYVFKYHNEYAGRVPLYYDPASPFSIEGGDILCLGGGLLMVGISERTTPEAIELLAERLFKDEESGFAAILAADIPNMRAYMHLDTVFTQVDRTVFTVHPGILPTLRLWRLDREDGAVRVKEQQGTLSDVLARNMNVDKVTLIRCGGSDRIASEREQWNDGSNTLCVAPGRVVVYDRNSVTNAILRDHGLTTIEVPGAELGRGRGGPRCMSMPFVRSEGK